MNKHARLREQYQEILDVNSTGAERLKFVLTENTRLRAELKVANHSIVSSLLYNTLKEKNASLRDENERLKDGGVQRIKDALAATLDARDAAIARAEKAEAEVEQTKDYVFWKDTAKTRAENIERASEQMLVYEQTIARLRAEVAELQDRLETSMDHHLKYRDNLREDLSEAHSKNEQLKEEIDQARRAWLGDDYGHLPLIEAMEKFRNDREAELDKLESDYNQLVASDNMIKVAHETATRSILNAHAAMDESGIIMTREKSHQGLTPRIKSIIARKLEVDTKNRELNAYIKRIDGIIEGIGGVTVSCINPYEDLRRTVLALKARAEKAEADNERLLEENVKLNGYADMHMKEKARADELQFRLDSLEK